MRTTITIDDALFDKASAAGGDKNVSSLVTKALELLVAADSKKRMLRLSGVMQDFSTPGRGTRGFVDYHDNLGSDENSMVAEDSPE